VTVEGHAPISLTDFWFAPSCQEAKMAALGAKKGFTQSPQRGRRPQNPPLKGRGTTEGRGGASKANPPSNHPYKVLPIAVRIVSNTSDSVSPSD